MTKLQQRLERLKACEEACEWVQYKSLEEAWNTCERIDWLFWWARRVKSNKKEDYVKVACTCAREVLHLVPEGEKRPLLAIKAAEKWLKDPSKKNASAAYYAAATATAYAAASYAASYAAYAATYATYAAATYVAAYAAEAATAYAADAATYASSKIKPKLLKIIRKSLKYK